MEFFLVLWKENLFPMYLICEADFLLALGIFLRALCGQTGWIYLDSVGSWSTFAAFSEARVFLKLSKKTLDRLGSATQDVCLERVRRQKEATGGIEKTQKWEDQL